MVPELSEASKERRRQELLFSGVERIEEVDGVSVVHFTREIYQSKNARELHNGSPTGSSLGDIGWNVVFICDRKNALFRCVDGGEGFTRVPDILKNGIDIPNFSADGPQLVDLGTSLDHASEYGFRRGSEENRDDGIMKHSRVVMVYDKKNISHMPGEGEGHKYKFLESPKQVLLSLVLLYGEDDKEDGLVDLTKKV